jgi:hypothetical protein
MRSNSKWKIVPSPFFTNLLWVVILHVSNIWMGKFVEFHRWTLWGIKKGLHNRLNSLLIWILQNMLTLHWQVNIITMNGHMKFCILVLGTWISKIVLALLSWCIIHVLRHQSMCLLLVLSSITTSLIKCKYNIFLKLEKWFLVHDVMDVLGMVSLEEILSIPTMWLWL